MVVAYHDARTYVKHTILRCAAALALAATAACASSGRTATTSSGGEVDLSNAPVTIRVSSGFPGPLALYSLDHGVASRLGEIEGSRTQEFHLTPTQIPTEGLLLVAVPLVNGTGRATTGRLNVRPGQVVDFNIGPALSDATTFIH